MIVHVLPYNLNIGKLHKLSGHLIQMHLLEALVSFQPFPNQVRKAVQDKARHDICPCQPTCTTITLTHIWFYPTQNLLNISSTIPPPTKMSAIPIL